MVSQKNGRAMVTARHGQRVRILDLDTTEQFQAHLRRECSEVVVGDQVIYQQAQDRPVVTSIDARRNALMRLGFHNKPKYLAANIDHLLIVVAPLPSSPEDDLDRYLVGATLLDIQASIVINKTDLLQQHPLSFEPEVYEDIGYACYRTDCQRANLGLLGQQFPEGNTILLGQSGVGKSSLLNTLLPTAQALTGDISEQTQTGTHTTTMACAYPTKTGWLIDSPGIRQFKFPLPTAQELASGFVEFKPFLGLCRFRDCLHQHEPTCALKDAVGKGCISEARYQCYLRILKECSN